MRRAAYAAIPLLALIGLGEAAGRALLPDPRDADDIAVTYDPSAPVVAEGRTFAHAGYFRPQTWAVPAPGPRVVVAGDSTVYGQFPAALAMGTGVEVLNFGLPGAASDRVRILAEAAFREDPDVVVVYVGHNEVVESRLNPVSQRTHARRLWEGRLRASGVGRLLRRVVPGLGRPPGGWGFRKSGDAAAVPVTEAEWTAVAAGYRRNLEGICDARGDVALVLVEPVSSLLRAPEVAEGEDAAGTYRDAVAAGEAALATDPAAAMAWAERLLRDFPSRAPGHHLRGRALLALGRRDEGIAALREARRIDARPGRATEAHQAIVREVAAACGARSAAPEAAFLADPRGLAPGDPLFMDTVHPTVAGNVLLAGVVAAATRLPWDAGAVSLVEPATDVERGWKLR